MKSRTALAWGGSLVLHAALWASLWLLGRASPGVLPGSALRSLVAVSLLETTAKAPLPAPAGPMPSPGAVAPTRQPASARAAGARPASPPADLEAPAPSAADSEKTQSGALVPADDEPPGAPQASSVPGGELDGAPAQPAAVSAATGQGGRATGAGAPEGVDAQRMHELLAEAAARCYPAAARPYHLRGTVDVAFCVQPGGEATQVSLKGSTGSGLLDNAARGCVVQRAGPFPPQAAGGCFTVPVRFGLTN